MSPTRRQVLRGALPAVLGLAGCTNAESTDRTPRTAESQSGRERDPAVVKPRNLEGEPVIAAYGESDRGGNHRRLVTDRHQADGIEFAAGVPAEDVAATRAFLDATDFSEETIYVAPQRIESCYRYRIRAVSWKPGRIEYEYCQELRPPDVRCEADRYERVSLFFRIPAALELDVTSTGSSGRSPCRIGDTDWEVIEVNASDTDMDTGTDSDANPNSDPQTEGGDEADGGAEEAGSGDEDEIGDDEVNE